MQPDPAHTLQPVAVLMMDEAHEFEILDALPPFDDYGNVAWQFEGEPTTRREKRWLQLYTKLSAASPINPRSLGSSPQNEAPTIPEKPKFLKIHFANFGLNRSCGLR
jgi:hypothetical protein